MKQPSSAGGEWPTTKASWIDACAHPSRPGAAEAIEALIRAYRRCLYKYIRRHGIQPNDAKDILQRFLLSLTSGKLFRRYRKGEGRFRFYLIGCLKKEIRKHRRGERRRRDAGALPLISEDETNRYEAELADTRGADPETQVEKDWARDLIANSIEAVATRLDDPLDRLIFKGYAIILPEDRPDPETFTSSLPGAGSITPDAMKERASRLLRRLRREMVSRVALECRTGEDEKAALNELLSSLLPRPKKGADGGKPREE